MNHGRLAIPSNGYGCCITSLDLAIAQKVRH